MSGHISRTALAGTEFPVSLGTYQKRISTGASATAAAGYHHMFTATQECEVDDIRIRYSADNTAASTIDGIFTFTKVPAGYDYANDTSNDVVLLDAAIDLDDGNEVPSTLAIDQINCCAKNQSPESNASGVALDILVSDVGKRTLKPGDSVYLWITTALEDVELIASLHVIEGLERV